MSNIKTANLNVRIKNFFMRYIEFLQPFHKLPKQEQKLLALLLYYHYKLRKEITNNRILWKEVFDYDTKLLIAEEMEIGGQALENLLTKLRKKNVIIDKQVSALYIPDLGKDSKTFTITFNFNINYE